MFKKLLILSTLACSVTAFAQFQPTAPTNYQSTKAPKAQPTTNTQPSAKTQAASTQQPIKLSPTPIEPVNANLHEKSTPAKPAVNNAPILPVDSMVAIVNDQVITENELNSQVQMIKSQWKSKDLPPEQYLRKQILNELILQKIEVGMAKRNNITVDDSTLNQALEGIAKQQNMTLRQLRSKLADNGVTYRTFREQVRTQLLTQQVEQAVASQIKNTPAQIASMVKELKDKTLSESEYNVDVITIPLNSPSVQQIAQAKAKAQQLIAQAKTPAQFERLAKINNSGGSVGDWNLGWKHIFELPDAYQVVKDWKVGEVKAIQTDNGIHILRLAGTRNQALKQHIFNEYHVQMIYLPTNKMTTKLKARDEMWKRAQYIYSLLGRHKPGDPTFAELAKSYSQDPSKAKGGDTGWVKLGALPTDMQVALKTARIDVVNPPLKTKSGIYIFKLLGKREINDTENYYKQMASEILFKNKYDVALSNWQSGLRADAYVKILDPSLKDSDD